jgi:erythronate-4-phosphate dehydrogenase
MLSAINSHISAAVSMFGKRSLTLVQHSRKTDIATPHIAGYSFDGKVRGTEMIYRAAADCFD